MIQTLMGVVLVVNGLNRVVNRSLGELDAVMGVFIDVIGLIMG